MSTFIQELHQDLTAGLAVSPLSPSLSSYTKSDEASDFAKNALRECFAELQPPRNQHDLADSIEALRGLLRQGVFTHSSDEEQQALQSAIVTKVVVGFYLTILEETLDQARRADAQLEWWLDIERSRRNLAYYLLQTFPIRLVHLASTIVDAVQAQRLPLRLSAFSPSSIRQMFPTTNILQPNTLTVAIFPHLRHQPYPSILLQSKRRALRLPFSQREQAIRDISHTLLSLFDNVRQTIASIAHLPIELTRHECRFKRERLEKIRDERATLIGRLVYMRTSVLHCVGTNSTEASVAVLHNLVTQANHQSDTKLPPTQTVGDIMQYLETLVSEYLPAQVLSYRSNMIEQGLDRPSRLVLNWPKLVFLPPLVLYGARTAYSSRASLEQVAKDAVDTVKHFWRDWLLAPMQDVLKTVRAGSNEGVIITHESVKADLDSLERMALALAQDKLHYTPEQMNALSQQIRIGDLTPVMQIYEDDIRSPLKSAVGGTLLRTLLVQVQKAKVDINQAVSGIDKLLKSQELTFAFVGVAPAITITYIALGYLRSLWFGKKGRSRYGGRYHRTGAWTVMRRIERLLITSSLKEGSATIEPRTSGLLLLSTTQLRGYAERHLPSNSRLREGFMQDVKDLENPSLGRKEKLRVVDRMWNSWGDVLGWRRVGGT